LIALGDKADQCASRQGLPGRDCRRVRRCAAIALPSFTYILTRPPLLWKRIRLVRQLVQRGSAITVHEPASRPHQDENNEGAGQKRQNPKPRPKFGIVCMPIRSASTNGHGSLHRCIVNAHWRGTVPGSYMLVSLWQTKPHNRWSFRLCRHHASKPFRRVQLQPFSRIR